VFQDVSDIPESVAEDEVVGAAQVRLFPVVLPALVAVGQREDAEVHRAHVERAHFGLRHQWRRKAFLHGHVERAAGGDVEHRVG
jgi:hypothetical protein